jgi:hypothetical protein
MITNWVNQLIKLQKRVALIITFSDFRASSEQLFKLLNWMPFGKTIELETCKFIYKSLNGLSSYLKFFSFETKRNTRSNDNKSLQISDPKLYYTQNCIFHKGVKLWNSIDLKIREIKCYKLFVKAIQNFFYELNFFYLFIKLLFIYLFFVKFLLFNIFK